MSGLKFWNTSSPLQRRAIVLVGVSLLVGFFISQRRILHNAASVPSWQTFATSGDHPFRIQMPVSPRHSVHDVALPSLGITVRKGIFVSEDSATRQYVLSVTSYPVHTPPFPSAAIVQAEMQALFPKSSDYRIDVTPKDNGADFSARRFDGGPLARGRILIDGASVYVFSFSAPPEFFSDELYQTFITSFQK